MVLRCDISFQAHVIGQDHNIMFTMNDVDEYPLWDGTINFHSSSKEEWNGMISSGVALYQIMVWHISTRFSQMLSPVDGNTFVLIIDGDCNTNSGKVFWEFS